MVAGGRMRLGEMGEGSQEVQISNYKISEAWGCNVQQGDCSQ